MHIDRRLVGFGLFLITVGGVMIAVRQGLIANEEAAQNPSSRRVSAGVRGSR